MWEHLETLRQWGQLTDLDVHFGRFIARVDGDEAPALVMAACLASHATSNSHVCLDLHALAGQPLFANTGLSWTPPPLESWTEMLLASSVVGRPGDFRPLVLDEAGRLYLYRYWDYEQQLVDDLRRRIADNPHDVDETRLGGGLKRLFPQQEPTGPGVEADVSWPKIAAAVSVLKRFCVITGGPGTGKTRTVARLLALLLEQANGKPLRIALAAPTGKAAMRLREAVHPPNDDHSLDPAVGAAIAATASTLHRLLGIDPNTGAPRYTRDHPLPVDVLVIDEASMVDLALMSKTVQALPPQARLILLGDKDQLASVDAGAVLGDICCGAPALSGPFRERLTQLTTESLPREASRSPAIGDSVILLRRSYRFSAESGIGQLARAVNRSHETNVIELLQQGIFPDLSCLPTSAVAEVREHLSTYIRNGYEPYLQLVRSRADPSDIFAAFNRFRVLCALRNGPTGVAALNQSIEALLQASGLISPRQPWYSGRPVMINRNDYRLCLFNGDVGIALPDPEVDGRLHVCFEGADGSMRQLPPFRLPEHETVYSMTVHKSQGSEFDEVLLVLGDEGSPVMTRELLYTGVTRAKSRMTICGTEAAVRAAVSRRMQRSSGLKAALWG